MALTVTKETIIEAIKTEPYLAQGRWVHDPDYLWPPKEMREGVVKLRKEFGKNTRMPVKVFEDGDNCPVCAVGAVLRNIGLANNEIVNFADNVVLKRETEIIDGSVRPTIPNLADPSPEVFNRNEERYFEIADRNIQGALDDGNYLLALSNYFECYFPTKRELLSWVKKNIPEDAKIKVFKKDLKETK